MPSHFSPYPSAHSTGTLHTSSYPSVFPAFRPLPTADVCLIHSSFAIITTAVTEVIIVVIDSVIIKVWLNITIKVSLIYWCPIIKA